MALGNAQISSILREYDNKQQKSHRILQERRKEIYKRIPAIKEMEDELATNAVTATKLALSGDEDAIDILKAKNQALIEAKAELLSAHGYASDYLNQFYFCSDCKDTGYITDHVWKDEEHLLLSSDKCHCFKQAIIDLLYDQSGIRTVLEEENFSTFDYNYFSKDYIDPFLKISAFDNICRNVSHCQSFIQNFDNEFKNLLFLGNSGVGKTFLTNCIAKELLDQSHTVIYLTAFQFFDILTSHAFQRKNAEYNIEEKYHGIMDCSLLIIDDLGTEVRNTLTNSQLFECINERLINKRSTIISTNLTIDELKPCYSERIFSRISSNYDILKLFGDDIRLKKTYQ